ncbi:MAG: ABC transporter ATP-binding protein [bacterium]|nr:ABC transporter ATP-binding protein [bacterium]
MTQAIDIENLSHQYGERLALDGVNLQIKAGEIFGLLGPNGGGKTTLFRILSTLLTPTRGRVRVLGVDPVDDGASVRSRIGVVFQSPSLDPKLTVLENMRHHGYLYGLKGALLQARIEDVLKRVDLFDRREDRAEVLSGGLQRRVELGKGLLHRPELLIFDEPSTGLDPAARRIFWDHLESLRTEDGVTMVLTTHFMEEADRCDRIGILDAGKLIAVGTPDELKRSVGKDVITLETQNPDGVAKQAQEAFHVVAQVIDGTVRIECDSGQDLMGQLYARFRDGVTSMTLASPTLEDVFIQRTGHRFEVAADA